MRNSDESRIQRLLEATYNGDIQKFRELFLAKDAAKYFDGETLLHVLARGIFANKDKGSEWFLREEEGTYLPIAEILLKENANFDAPAIKNLEVMEAETPRLILEKGCKSSYNGSLCEDSSDYFSAYRREALSIIHLFEEADWSIELGKMSERVRKDYLWDAAYHGDSRIFADFFDKKYAREYNLRTGTTLLHEVVKGDILRREAYGGDFGRITKILLQTGADPYAPKRAPAYSMGWGGDEELSFLSEDPEFFREGQIPLDFVISGIGMHSIEPFEKHLGIKFTVTSWCEDISTFVDKQMFSAYQYLGYREGAETLQEKINMREERLHEFKIVDDEKFNKTANLKRDNVGLSLV